MDCNLVWGLKRERRQAVKYWNINYKLAKCQLDQKLFISWRNRDRPSLHFLPPASTSTKSFTLRKFSYQTYGNIKYQPQYHRMFGESVFLVKCCGFNWQLSHSHANNQPTEKLSTHHPSHYAAGKVISAEKKNFAVDRSFQYNCSLNNILEQCGAAERRFCKIS